MLELTVVIRGYDSLFPLSRGEINTPGLNITLDHRTSIDALAAEDPPPAGEMSLSRYLLGVAAGDDRWVGLPMYVIRGFRQRSFWVRSDSTLTSLSELRNARVGMSGWADSGNTWARAALADADVNMDDVRWILGPPNRNYPRTVSKPTGDLPEGGVTMLAAGDSLTDATLRGELDAVSLAFPSDELFRPDAPLRRLVRDYRSDEMGYLSRTGIYPAFHTLVIRRDIFARDPGLARGLYQAMEASWLAARSLYRTFGDATPWMQYDLDEADRLLGAAAAPFGIEHPIHRNTIDGLGRAQLAQRLTRRAATADEAFGEVGGLLA